MFVDFRVALVSRAAALGIVLDIELTLILADPTGSGGFMLLDPVALLVGATCYLALSGRPGGLTSQEGDDEYSA